MLAHIHSINIVFCAISLQSAKEKFYELKEDPMQGQATCKEIFEKQKCIPVGCVVTTSSPYQRKICKSRVQTINTPLMDIEKESFLLTSLLLCICVRHFILHQLCSTFILRFPLWTILITS